MSFSPFHPELAVASRGQVEFWSTSSWRRTRTATNFFGIPHIGVIYPPDARSIWLIKGVDSGGLYDWETLAPLLLLPNGILPLAVDSSGRYLAVSKDAQRLQVWDMIALRRELKGLGLDWQ
jgi:hypothetical protein